MRRFDSLRRRSDFAWLRRRGRRFATPTVTLYRDAAKPSDRLPLVGITVAATVGKAVVRNTVRRRLAAIVHEALDGRPKARLLLIAAPLAARASYQTLRVDLTAALARAAAAS